MHFADYHTHSSFSADSDANLEGMIQKAVTLGLSEIAITDHLDFVYKTLTPYPHIDLDAYAAEVLRLKEKYKNKITVVFGLELGLTPEIAAASRTLTCKYPFDFIICSTHDIHGKGLYGRDFFEGKSKSEAYGIYFSQILEVINAEPDFDVYGHFDYIDRYGIYTDNSLYYADYKDIIDEILKNLISRGKGLEVNTSGYRYGLNRLHPQIAILKRFKELGGSIVTIGSDAHHPGAIAEKFDNARSALIEAGFCHVTAFKNRLARPLK